MTNSTNNLWLKKFREWRAEEKMILPQVIAGYWPLPHEVDVMPLLEGLALEGYTCTLPAIESVDKPLVFREWIPSEPMEENLFFIPQPKETAPSVDPSFLFVPMLAFDDRGYRLGYGGGFYDRTLCALRKARKIMTVGLAFDNQLVSRVPVEDHDQRLDYILTQTHIYGPFYD